jgi:hypothetical protein
MPKQMAAFQPEPGETVLSCIHVAEWWDGGRPPKTLHWFYLDSTDGRTPLWVDGKKMSNTTHEVTAFRARFGCICPACESIGDLDKVLVCDFTWEDDEPVIERENLS